MRCLLFILTFFYFHTGFAQVQKYNCEVIELTTGKLAKLNMEIEINDSLIIFKEIKTNEKTLYKIISKSINGNLYNISDGVRDVLIEIVYYKHPPIWVKGKFYHFWIHYSFNGKRATYFGELVKKE